MKLGKNIGRNLKGIIAATALSLFGCAHNNINSNNNSSPAINPVSLIEAEANKFSEVITQGLSGKYKIRVVKPDAQLNAHYSESDDSIIVDCYPGFEKCYFEAVSHEIGHYIWAHLLQEEKDKLNFEISKRLSLPDAIEFQALLKKLQDEKEKIAVFLNQYTNLITCNSWVEGYNRINKISSAIVQGLKGKISDKEYKNLEEKLQESKLYFEKYRADEMPSCNEENLKIDNAQSNALWEVIDCLAVNSDRIYYSDNLPLMQCPTLQTEHRVVDKPKKPLMNNSIAELGSLIERAIFANSLEQSIIIPNYCYSNGKCGSITGESIILENIKYTISSLHNSGAQFSLALIPMRMVHDEDIAEQFSAVVDSLYSGYCGPVTMAPMKLKLTNSLLDALGQTQFKGSRIFQDAVKEYKKKCQDRL